MEAPAEGRGKEEKQEVKITFETIKATAVPWIVTYRDHDGQLIEKEFQTVSRPGTEEESWRAYVQVKNLGEFIGAVRKEELVD
jgi:hypothetical protein